MIIICGKTIAEVERDLEMAKRAIATGAPMGIGGATIADVEQAMAMLKGECGAVAPIDNPNYVGVPPIEDDEDEICPICDNYWDGCYCEHCGYPDEDENEDEDEVSNEDFIAWLKENDAPNYLVQLAERVLGL